MFVPVEIKVVDPVLLELGGPPVPGSADAAAVDLMALGIFEQDAEGKPIMSSRHPGTGPGAAPWEGCTVRPGQLVYLCTGFDLHIVDPAYAAIVIPRSSSARLGTRLGNSVALYDPDYQGRAIVMLENRTSGEGARDIHVARGERVAQMFLVPRLLPKWEIVEEFSSKTRRGAGAFGSTGLTGTPVR